jgi:Cyclin
MSSLTANLPIFSQDAWSRPAHRIPHSTEASHGSNSEGPSSNSWFTGGLPTPPGTNMNGLSVGSTLPAIPSNYSYPSQQAPAENPSFQQRSSFPSQHNVDFRQHSRMNSTGGKQALQAEKSVSNVIARHLQIPESVNKTKGSLAEFAAEITCLFWFEASTTIEYAETLPQDVPVDRGLAPDAVPSIGFRKWVTTILSTTQVGKNVILLALMFIYRLKKFNPSVSGKKGSEFRLLTVALMLGNKFLDDNTYTNKTWAEVSGISVTEIHIMEVEFLSNMRYDLYVSELEWKDWKSTLGRLGSFYEKALKFVSGPSPVTPSLQSFGQKLPSPPSARHSQKFYQSAPLNHDGYVGLPKPVANAPHLPPSPLRQQRASSVDYDTRRKRSLDIGSEQSATKRMHLPPTNPANGGMHMPVSHSSYGSGTTSVSAMNYGSAFEGLNYTDVPRLPIPRLAVPNTMSYNNQLAPLSLPINQPMSSVYPTTTNVAWPQSATPGSAVPANMFQSSIPNLSDMSRPHSNIPSAHTSPVGYATNTPILPGLSPSYFLTNRSSPYRPVRHVNTLMIPPPSAALQNPIRNIDHDQIYHQPLSKATTEPRPGPIPFMQPEGWQASNANTPTQQKWPNRF